MYSTNFLSHHNNKNHDIPYWKSELYLDIHILHYYSIHQTNCRYILKIQLQFTHCLLSCVSTLSGLYKLKLYKIMVTTSHISTSGWNVRDMSYEHCLQCSPRLQSVIFVSKPLILLTFSIYDHRCIFIQKLKLFLRM